MIVLLIAEIFVPGFFLLCLGIGCIGGSLAALVGGGESIQLLSFSAASLVAFFTLRPFLMRRAFHNDSVLTNADALVGQRGRVTQDFEPGIRLGRVAVGGDDWRAECTAERTLLVGDLVEVVRVDSNTLIVKPYEHP